MRAKNKGLADVLFGKGRGAILALLYGQPDVSFYYRQIARRLKGVSVGTLQRELLTLTDLDLVTRLRFGNQVHYRANRKHPVYAELRALVSKTIGAIHVLQSALAPLGEQIVLAFLYGSMARQEERAESDIDLMIVGTTTLEEVLLRLDRVQDELGREINPTVYSVSEFRSKLAKGNHFLTAVVRGEKIFLFGDENELGKVAGARLVKGRTHRSR